MRKLKSVSNLKVGQSVIVFGFKDDTHIAGSLATVIENKYVRVKYPWNMRYETIQFGALLTMGNYGFALVPETPEEATDKMVKILVLKRELAEYTTKAQEILKKMADLEDLILELEEEN